MFYKNFRFIDNFHKKYWGGRYTFSGSFDRGFDRKGSRIRVKFGSPMFPLGDP